MTSISVEVLQKFQLTCYTFQGLLVARLGRNISPTALVLLVIVVDLKVNSVLVAGLVSPSIVTVLFFKVVAFKMELHGENSSVMFNGCFSNSDEFCLFWQFLKSLIAILHFKICYL